MSLIDRVGIKRIKIVLAVIVSLLVGNLLKFDSPYLTAINALIGIQGTISSSFTNAKDRVIGTIIGVLMGFITVTFISEGFLITTIGIFIIIYACNLLKLKNSIVQASIMYLSIMLFPSTNQSVIGVAISTIGGVLIAIVINFVLTPFELRSSIHKSYDELKRDIFCLCLNLFTTNETIDLKEFNSRVMAFKSLVKSYNNEYFKFEDKELEFNKIDVLYKNVNAISFFIYTIRELRMSELTIENKLRIHEILDICVSDLDSSTEESDELFNFHVSKLLDYLEMI